MDHDDTPVSASLVCAPTASRTHNGSIEGIYALVTGRDAIARLRARWRIVGAAATTATAIQDDAVVRLSVEEIAVGLSEGFLLADQRGIQTDDVVHTPRVDAIVAFAQRCATSAFVDSSPVRIDALACLRIRVFADLWGRGYFVAFGSKFGVDFLIYQDDPNTCHAAAMILVKEWSKPFSSEDIVGHCRMAKMVKKSMVFASVHEGVVMYISLDHALLAARQE